MASNEERGSSGLQNVIRVISILPCFPSYQPRPNTPNFDQVSLFKLYYQYIFSVLKPFLQLTEILNRFRSQDSNTDMSVLDRVSSTDLCAWSQKVLTFLPSVDDVPESDAETRDMLTHFDTIKVIT